MKKIFLALMILQSLFSFSQDLITTKRGKVYNSDNQKLSVQEVKSLLTTNPEALKLYSVGKTKQIVGNAFLLTGFALVAGKYVFGKRSSVDFSSSSNVTIFTPNYYLVYIGGSLMVASIPILIGHEKKIKKSINLINEDLKNPTTTYNFNTNIILNQNGLGISIQL